MIGKYTPGPWTIDKNVTETDYLLCCDISDRNRGYVASLAVTNEDALSNAKLIAAAPDLLEALKKAVDALELADDSGTPGLRKIIAEADTAIRKAEGEGE